MTKTLTEQWRDGDMEGGIYYCKTKSYGEKKLWFHHRVYGGMYVQTYGTEEMFPEEDIVEVLAPVPSYDEYQGLLSDQLAKNEATEINAELEHKVERLQEQLESDEMALNEAQEIIAELETKLKKATELNCNHAYKTNKRRIQINNLKNENNQLREQLKEKNIKLNELRHQRNEANEVIKEYVFHEYLTPETYEMRNKLEVYCKKYKIGEEKWGVK